jgi:signal transduction histidine kinase/ActR/RegA family two-component response regulator
MILHSVARSVRSKLMLVVLATTFMALLVSATALVVYDVRTYQASWVNDLVTQAEIIARASGPAIAFNDPAAARENLGLLKVRPKILAAAIYLPNGTRFATYSHSDADKPALPDRPDLEGYSIRGDQLVLYHPILEKNEMVGTVYLQARYELVERLRDYIAILVAVMACSLLIAALVAAWLQAAITKPILAVTNVAHEVIERRDFSLRVHKTTEDEIGVLVDAFNGMLNEVGQRAAALEASNRTLALEMNVRRSAEEALLTADRRKDEFLATLAHELRNPLAPLSTALEILRMAGGDADAAQRARDIMERQLKQMVRLVDDLLDVSRITTGKLTINKDRITLQTVVRDAVETVRSFIDSYAHVLIIDLPETPIYLEADATRLAQVFSNLLNNAAKYTTSGGRISFAAEQEGEQIVIRVTDSGIGISNDMLPRIFEMFTQADYSLERSHAGLGVGLTLAKRLVELHGGTIEARSAGLNRGSEFIVRLPTVPASAQLVAKAVNQDADGSLALHRILLADDNVDFATSMATLMRAMGHQVHITHDGAEALAAAGWFAPDFAFLDIGLPKLNGYDLARHLRALPATKHSILIAVTGWGQEKDRQLAHEAGFDHHMVKPVKLEHVQALLQGVWTKR